MPAVKFAPNEGVAVAPKQQTPVLKGEGREDRWDGSCAGRPRSESGPKWTKKASTPSLSPKGAVSNGIVKSVKPPNSPSIDAQESRVIHRGHGRDLDVFVICVPVNQRPWPAGRGRPCAGSSPQLQPRGMRREESDTLQRPRRASHVRSSPMIKAMINGTIPCEEAPKSAPTHPSSPMTGPRLGLLSPSSRSSSGVETLASQPPLYEILSLHFDRVLDRYPLFMQELSKQPTHTQMSLALDWAANDKPPRLVSTVESCLAKGFFRVRTTGKASPKSVKAPRIGEVVKDVKASPKASKDAAPGSASPVVSLASLTSSPSLTPSLKSRPRRDSRKKHFDPSAESFTPPLKPMSAKPSPSLDPKAAEFVPPSVRREEEKRKKLDPGASEWTPTTKPLLSGKLNPTAAEWTPPSVRAGGTPSSVSTSVAGSAKLLSTRASPKITSHESGADLFEPLPAGPATFASQQPAAAEEADPDSPCLPPGDSFDLYGRQG